MIFVGAAIGRPQIKSDRADGKWTRQEPSPCPTILRGTFSKNKTGTWPVSFREERKRAFNVMFNIWVRMCQANLACVNFSKRIVVILITGEISHYRKEAFSFL